jgi:hypothetical protein
MILDGVDHYDRQELFARLSPAPVSDPLQSYYDAVVTVHPSWVHSLREKFDSLREEFRNEPPLEIPWPHIRKETVYSASIAAGTFVSSAVAAGFLVVEAAAYTGSRLAQSFEETKVAGALEQTMQQNQLGTVIALGAFAVFSLLSIGRVRDHSQNE